MAGTIKKFFKDVPTGGWFRFEGRDYKKMSYEHGKDIFYFTLKDFFPEEEVEINEDSKFKLNF